MKKLIVCASFLFLASAILFAAGPVEEAEESPDPADMAAEPVTIRLQGYAGQDIAVVTRLRNEVLADDLEALNIELVYEPIEGDYNAGLFNGLSAGTAGDIVYIPGETAPAIIATGAILPLSGQVDLSSFVDSLVNVFEADGQVYGIPKDFNTLAIFYNRDLFDAAGVDYPTDNETWDSLGEKAAGVAALDSDTYGIAFQPGYDRFGAFAYGTGWTPFSANGMSNVKDPRFVSAITWYTDLIANGAAVIPSDLGEGWTGGAFATEQVGMAVEGAWMIGFLNDNAPNIPYGTVLLPAANGGDKGNFIFTVAYGVNANSPNVEAALEVLELLTSEEAQQFILENGLAIPSRESLADNPYFASGTPAAEANLTVFRGSQQGNNLGFQFGTVGTDWMAPVNNALSAIITSGTSVDEALDTAQAELDALF